MTLDAMDIVEVIMTQHWDMVGCPCWVCVEGRQAGCRPREKYLQHYAAVRRAEVEVLEDGGSEAPEPSRA